MRKPEPQVVTLKAGITAAGGGGAIYDAGRPSEPGPFYRAVFPWFGSW